MIIKLFAIPKDKISINEIQKVTEKAESCTVSLDEHAKLSVYDGKYHGWNRYKMAKIRVFDKQKGNYIELY